MHVITGATGNIGRVLVKALRGKGIPVRAVGRDADRLKALAQQGQRRSRATSATCSR